MQSLAPLLLGVNGRPACRQRSPAIFALPIFPELREDEQQAVVGAIAELLTMELSVPRANCPFSLRPPGQLNSINPEIPVP
jgi:hypothetical protein